jgi:YlmC/YmxH family sporulation protein
MDSNVRLYSEIEGYEIVNVNDGEKYCSLSNHDIIVDDDGNMKSLVLNKSAGAINFFSKNDYYELPFNLVKKIGAKTIIIDAKEDQFIKAHL